MATRISSDPLVQPSYDRQLLQGDTPTPLATAGPEHFLVGPSLPDEAIISVVGRFHILSSNGTPTATFQELFSCAPFNLSAWIPPHIEMLAPRIGKDVEACTLEILRAHTLYPLLAIFNGLSFPAGPRRATANEATNTPKRLSTETIRLCPECLREDLDVYGVRYIHRSHQIPGVEVCSKHASPLLYKCPHCECSFSRHYNLALVPWRRCTCKKYVFDSISSAHESDPIALSYAQFVAALLQSAPHSTISPRVLVESYRERARAIGYSWGNDRVSHVRLKAEMEKFYGKAFLSRTDAAYREDRLSEWLKMLSDYSATEPPLGRHLLFAHFLFRDAPQFLATIGAISGNEQAAGTGQPALRRRTAGIGTGRNSKPSTKQRIAGLLRELTDRARDIPNCSIEDLWKSHYGLMKRLVSLDLETITLLRRKLQQLKPRQVGPTKVPHRSEKDGERARSVMATAAALYESVGKPERVTINRLAKDTGWNPSGLSQYAFPETLRAFEECVESNWHFYARRILWSKLTHKHAPISTIRARSGVEYHRSLVLMHFFQDVDPSVPYDAKTITHLLAERGIQRDWLGPCPEREFPPAGRQYYTKNLI
jgi:hypothetical protein